MNRWNKAMGYLRRGQIGKLFVQTFRSLPGILNSLIAKRRDKRFGGIPANRTLPSRFRELGANGTQSSDYRCLKRVFRAVPLRRDEVFLDVGCGEGRVLTYLYSRGFRGKAIGIELDPEVAKVAAARTAACENISICCGNVLNQRELLEQVTVIYLFNPFSRSVLHDFVALAESACKGSVRLYYLCDLYASELESSGRWRCLHSDVIRRPNCNPMRFSVYELTAG